MLWTDELVDSKVDWFTVQVRLFSITGTLSYSSLSNHDFSIRSSTYRNTCDNPWPA